MFNNKKVVITIVAFISTFSKILEASSEDHIKHENDAFVSPSHASNFGGNNLDQISNFPNHQQPRFEPEPPASSDVPKAEMEYNFRVYATNCSCPQKKKQVDVTDKKLKRIQHLPFGVPYSPEDNRTLRLLFNDDYITAFDLKYRIPMWTAFTINGKKSVSQNSEVCWTGDARIAFSDTAQCGDYDTSIVKRQYILQRPLFPPGFSDSSSAEQATYITNSIPKSLNHTKLIEKEVYQILGSWAEDGQLNVMMGPAFDLNGTGSRPDIGTIMRTHAIHGPLIVPTHIFVVATWCSKRNNNNEDCDPSKLIARGFLLPNKPFEELSVPATSIIERSTMSIAEIEKLTGLSFYTGLSIRDAVRLRSMIPKKNISNVK